MSKKMIASGKLNGKESWLQTLHDEFDQHMRKHNEYRRRADEELLLAMNVMKQIREIEVETKQK